MEVTHFWRSFYCDNSGQLSVHIQTSSTVDPRTELYIQNKLDSALPVLLLNLQTVLERATHPCDTIHPFSPGQRYQVYQNKIVQDKCHVHLEYLCFEEQPTKCEYFICNEIFRYFAKLCANVLEPYKNPQQIYAQIESYLHTWYITFGREFPTKKYKSLFLKHRQMYYPANDPFDSARLFRHRLL
jgi:hypothetical protein